MNAEEARFHELLNAPPFDGAYRDEHRAQLRRQVLEAFDASQADASRVDASRVDVSRRAGARMARIGQIMARPPLRRVAALVLAAAGACAVFAVMFHAQPTVALANLIDPILKARTARFNITIELNDLPKQTVRMLVLEPNRIRQELPSGQINIIDGNAGRMITLKPAQKLALSFNMAVAPVQPELPNFFDFLRTSLRTAQNNPALKAEPLGGKQIEKRDAIGYRVKQPNGEFEIWGDAKSRLPIVVEMKTSMLPNAHITMTDFEIDVELDESLFETEPPKGYRVETLDVAIPAEKDLIGALSLLCDDNGGQFPDTFDHAAIAAFIGRWVAKNPGKPDAAWNKKVTDATLPLTQGLVFAATLPSASNARYAGRGVKKGDATKAVFWYLPAKSSSYRVVHGDLSVKGEDTAPESPEAVPVTLEVSGADFTREILKRKPAGALPGPEPPRMPAPGPEPRTAARPKPSDPAAARIIERMAGVYAACNSYHDTGVVTAIVVMKNGERSVSEKPFTTAFVRPDRLRFEFEDKSGQPPTRYIVWSKGNEAQTWWNVTGLQKPKTLGLALAGATGVSGSSAATVPALLLPGQVWGSLKDLPEAKCADDDTLDAVACFRVKGKYGNSPITLWIAKESYLLRRIDMLMETDAVRVEQTTTYSPAINEKLPDELLEFDPPAGN